MSQYGVTNFDLMGRVLDQHVELEERQLRIAHLEDQVSRLSAVAETAERHGTNQDSGRPASEPPAGPVHQGETR